MSLATLIEWIINYTLWLFAAGLVLALLGLREISAAQKEQSETIFSLEKELAASRHLRGRAMILTALGFVALLSVFRFVVLPSQPTLVTPEATATRPGIQLPTLPPTPTPTRTLIPTRPRPTSLPATPTLPPRATLPPAVACPQPGVCITVPRSNAVVRGQVVVQGTANIPSFQFYKVEYGAGEEPQQWNSIGDIQRTPVNDGTLTVWNLGGFPDGTYLLRLTVVDASGNFPPPFIVRVVIQQ